MFNYQKAYCVQALPAFEGLNHAQRDAHSKLIPLIGELNQGRDLNIPLTEAIRGILDDLTTKEIAELSRASYFVGHWSPSLLEKPFENKRGESWKIANACDQILRERINPPHRIEIHDGILRVTFSRPDCWFWKEFALATEENLIIFKECGLPFGRDNIENSANILKEKIDDMWGDVDPLPVNDTYIKYLELERKDKLRKVKESHEEKLKSLKVAVEDSQIELNAYTWLIERDIPYDNCIYYSHLKTFCFGWLDRLTDKEKEEYTILLKHFPYPYKFK